jgi:hypothetical protein
MADLQVSIDSDIPQALLWIGTIRGQMPFAISQALNKTGFDVRKALNQGTTRHFDNPTRFTQTAFIVQRGNKADPTVLVGAQANRDYFGPQIRGGTRRTKEFEGFLRGISNGQLTRKLVPTTRVVDPRGNPRRRVFSQIQQGLSTTKPTGFFIGKPKGGSRPLGVYKRDRGRLVPYFLQVGTEPRYQPRFPMQQIGQDTISRVAGQYLRSSLERAIASAR